MKSYVLLSIVAVMCLVPTRLMASIEDMPEISAYNWTTGDDFSDADYTLQNWDGHTPSGITFGIDTDEEYGYLETASTSNSIHGYVVPTQSPDIIGIRSDMRLTSLDTGPSGDAYYALVYDIAPGASLYWGFSVFDGELQGVLMFSHNNGGAAIYHGLTDFDVVMGQTYNLAMVFDDDHNEFYCYLNGEKISNIWFPGVEVSFSNARFKILSKNINSRFEFDNVEFATIPEPATMLLLGLGGLFIRKR